MKMVACRALLLLVCGLATLQLTKARYYAEDNSINNDVTLDQSSGNHNLRWQREQQGRFKRQWSKHIYEGNAASGSKELVAAIRRHVQDLVTRIPKAFAGGKPKHGVFVRPAIVPLGGGSNRVTGELYNVEVKSDGSIGIIKKMGAPSAIIFDNGHFDKYL